MDNIATLLPVQQSSNDRITVSARDLYGFLEVKTAYKDWFPRMCEYGFEDGVDFCSFLSESSGGRRAHDAQLTIEMAKEICMLQRNEKGKMARQYFIQLEKDWNSPEKVMARALKIAERTVQQLTAKIESDAPKLETYERLAARDGLTNIRDTAKLLGIPQKRFVNFLIGSGRCYRDKHGRLRPYAGKGDGLFVVREYANDATGAHGVQTLVTFEGREYFAKKLKKSEVVGA